MTQQGDKKNAFKENNWVYNVTGKYPALTGWDFMHLVGKGTEWFADDAERSISILLEAEEYFLNGGVVALCWHWRDPSRETDSFYSQKDYANDPTKYAHFSIKSAVIEGSEDYQKVIRDIDLIAEQLKLFEQKNIPVIWRPLHEAAGTWFWWGWEGAEAYVKLWKILFNRFVHYHNLRNLIWVWNFEPSNNPMDWYPGDEYVDIAGIDIYPPQGDHNPQSIYFELIKHLMNGRKIVALTECGSIADPDFGKEIGTVWSFFMPWYTDYTTKHNQPEFWQKISTSSTVIWLDQMPNYIYRPSPPVHILSGREGPACYKDPTSTFDYTSAEHSDDVQLTSDEDFGSYLYLQGTGFISWTFDIATAGLYDIIFKYQNCHWE